MEIITTSYFRSNMAAVLNKVDAGKKIIIRRNNRMYAIVPVGSDDSDKNIAE